MFFGLMKVVKEGSLAVALSVAVVGAPAAAEASFWDDVKEVASVVPDLFNPSHAVGKMLSGAVLFGGGWAGAALVSSLAFPPAAFIAGVGIGIVGLGLIGWGIYQLATDSGSRNDGPARVPGTIPRNPGEELPGGGRDLPGGSGSETTPGNVPGGTNPNPPGGGGTGNPSSGRDIGGANETGTVGINVDRNTNTSGGITIGGRNPGGVNSGRPTLTPGRGTPR